MIMFILFMFLILGIIFFFVGFIKGIVQYIKGQTPSKLKSHVDYEPEPETDDDIQLQERILLLDETIVKYNQLLDNLQRQLEFTSDDKKRSIILSKQAITLEKLNRALEKREKLG